MIRRMFLLVVLMLALAAGDTRSPTSAGEGPLAIDAAAQAALLDLAWIAPVPADLNVEGYGLTYGTYQTAASGGVSIYGNAGPLTTYDEAFSTADPRQTYYESMSLRSDDDPDVVARQVTVVSPSSEMMLTQRRGSRRSPTFFKRMISRGRRRRSATKPSPSAVNSRPAMAAYTKNCGSLPGPAASWLIW